MEPIGVMNGEEHGYPAGSHTTFVTADVDLVAKNIDTKTAITISSMTARSLKI